MKWGAAVAAAALSLFVTLAAGEERQAAEGRRIYMTGGEGVARVFGAPAPAHRFSCRKCHGPFAEGGREGATAVPAIDWRSLSTAAPARPAYTAETFRSAVVDGRAANGVQLDPAMPRFELDLAGTDQLLAYLTELSDAERLGVEPRMARFGVLSTARSRAFARDYAQRLERALAAEGQVFGRRLTVSVVEAPDGASVGAAVRQAQVLAFVGLAPADAEALPTLSEANVPTLLPLFALSAKHPSSIVFSGDLDEAALLAALADQIKRDGASSVAIVTDDAPAKDATRATIEARSLASRAPGEVVPAGTVAAFLLVSPFDRSLAAAMTAARSFERPGFYAIAGQLGDNLATLRTERSPVTLAVDNYAAVRLAVETKASITEAHAQLAAKQIAEAAADVGRRLTRSAFAAALSRQPLFRPRGPAVETLDAKASTAPTAVIVRYEH